MGVFMSGGLPQHTGITTTKAVSNVSAASTTMGTVPAGKQWLVFAAALQAGSAQSGVTAVAASITLNGVTFLTCQCANTGATDTSNASSQLALSISDGVLMNAGEVIALTLNNVTGANASGSVMFREVPA